MIAFNLTPSSLLSKNGVSLRNPSLSYQRWFYFCLFLLEQFNCRWVSFTTKSPLPRRWRGAFLFYARFALGRALLWGFAGRGTWRGRRPVCPAGPACAGKCKPAAAKSRARGTAATAPRARRSVFQTMRISSIRQGCGVCAAGHMPRFRPVSPGGQITPPALRPLPLRARRTRRRAGPALPGAAPPRAGRCPPG